MIFTRINHRLLSVLIIAGLVLALTSFAFSAAGDTTRVSVNSSGTQANDDSISSAHGAVSRYVSADGRYVAFASRASNLVVDDNNGATDVFVHDRSSGDTTRVSISSSGIEGNDFSSDPSISADGRYVAFQSRANNLVSDDTNETVDVFVHDRDTGVTERVSVDSSGTEANANSNTPSISADGKYVAFSSRASNLVSDDTNNLDDVFVHTRSSGNTTRASVDSSGDQGNSASLLPSISADGRYVAFTSNSSNLVSGDTNSFYDVFVRDRLAGSTTQVSVAGSGDVSNGNSFLPSISADGRYIAFWSFASNLVSADNNFRPDVFVYDRTSNLTTRVSVNSSGLEGNDSSFLPSISGDGRYIAFESNATNLVSGDTNGTYDIFVHDGDTGITKRVSVDSSGNQANGHSGSASISADGTSVAFGSTAWNLVSGDTNGSIDIFVNELAVVTNQPPTVNAGGPYNGDEGSAIALTGTASDVDGDTLSYAWSSDGPCTFSDSSTLNPTLTCDDDGTFTATLTVDDGTTTSSSTATVLVINVTPTVESITAPSDPVAVDLQPIEAIVEFSDPGIADSHTTVIDWGDGARDTFNGPSPVSASHTYAEAGVYTLNITVTDDDGGTASATYEYVVIYDPDGGFVTGHGRIYSEAGWCYLDNLCNSAEGNARFGFVSRYNKGDTVPTGRTDFVFRAGNLNFGSDQYEWLIVTGSNYAKFKGSGTINGALAPNNALYKFQIWAGDGTGSAGDDTFRIKIWYEVEGTETVVYDNGFDQAIGGGNIKVQSK